jgi:hypothetical protein
MRLFVSATFLIASIGLLASCESFVDPEEQEQAPLEVVSVDPGMYDTDVPTNVVLRIKLNKHLDVNYFTSREVNLRSGRYGKWLMSYYNPLDMSLVLWTSKPLFPGTVWELSFEERFRALDGGWSTPTLVTRFQTGVSEIEQDVYTERTYSRDVKPIFDAHCVGCHGEEQFTDLDLRDPAGLTRTALNIRSVQWPLLERIVPDRPGASYLVYKLLDGENMSGQRMPRTMNGSQRIAPLSMEEKRIIVDWILSGTLF